MTALHIIGAFIALVLLIAALTGTGWKFEKSILIAAPLGKVWDHINTLHAINAWNPWLDSDPTLSQEYAGTDGTPGASYSWDSPVKNVGAGNQTILTVTERSELTTRVNFIRPFRGTGESYLRLTDDQGVTRVSWGMVSSTPYPMNIIKLFGVIEKNMDRDFGRGLAQLKKSCEI